MAIKQGLLASMFAIAGFWAKAQQFPLLVGTYTNAKSEGIYVYSFDVGNGMLTQKQVMKASNPSFLTLSPNKNFVYSVNQNYDTTFGKIVTGEISAFNWNAAQQQLSFMNQSLSLGSGPCHITMHPSGKWLVTTNYFSGDFTILPVAANGTVGKPAQHVQHVGNSMDTVRQKSPHAHSSYFSKNGQLLWVQDLGIDKIMLYHFDVKLGIATPAKQPFINTTMGAGPRHLAIHPSEKYVYVVEELSNTIEVAAINKKGNYQIVQNIASTPLTEQKTAGAADIHLTKDGKFLYVSNRGNSNTIGVFAVDASTGKLSLVQHISCGGIAPRNFTIDPTEHYVLVANQKSDNIVVFKRDVNNGQLQQLHEVASPTPVCLQFIATE